MEILLATALASLALLAFAVFALPSADRPKQQKRLTVNEIRSRLDAESPHASASTSRRY